MLDLESDEFGLSLIDTLNTTRLILYHCDQRFCIPVGVKFQVLVYFPDLQTRQADGLPWHGQIEFVARPTILGILRQLGRATPPNFLILRSPTRDVELEITRNLYLQFRNSG